MTDAEFHERLMNRLAAHRNYIACADEPADITMLAADVRDTETLVREWWTERERRIEESNRGI